MMFLRLLARWLIGVVAVLLTVWIMTAIGAALRAPEVWTLRWSSTLGVVIFVPLLALVNAVVGSVLRLMSLPLTCVTFGLFGVVINAIVFWIAGAATGAQMTVLTALIAPILITLIATPLSLLVEERI